MPASLAFDQAVAFYDKTRGIPEWVSRAITDSLTRIAQLTPAARILEIGIGTGRIALPLLQRGIGVIGIDLSLAMMEEIQKKVAGQDARAALAQADANALPFPDASFDCAYAVNVYHVVANWQHALREARRVVKPGGCFLVSYGYIDPQSSFGALRRKLAEMAREYGVGALHPGAQSHDEVQAELERLGETRIVEVVRWSNAIVPARIVDGLAARRVSETWLIPDAVLAQIIPRLRAFAQAEFGDLSREMAGEERFVWIVARRD